MPTAPSEMSLTNVETGETLPAQFNPLTPTVELEAFWNRLKIPGAGHEELQYSNTGNLRVSFELLFDGATKDAPDMDEVQNMLFSLLSPPRTVSGVSTGAPPRILFAWPRWISIVSTMPKLKLAPKRFRPDGGPDYLSFMVDLEERRSTRLGNELVRLAGLRRSA